MSVAFFFGMMLSALAMQATVVLFGYRFSKGEHAAIERSTARDIFPAFVPALFFLMFSYLAAIDWSSTVKAYWELLPIAILTWLFGILICQLLCGQRTEP
jgi:mannose/fructose/N-acetylgalactosamine-specific phosphotransferase system component IID